MSLLVIPARQDGYAGFDEEDDVTPRVLEPSREDLLARRERLLERVHMTREEIQAHADAGTLTGDEYWTWKDILSIEFLLGADDGGR